MIEKKLGGMSPARLRMVLLSTIFIMIIISGIGFWFFKGMLQDYATVVNNDAKRAEVSSSDITTLQRLKTQLEDDKVAVNRTKSIVADSKSYAYQNQIINDINAYAKSSDVSIAGYGFASDTATGTTAAAQASSTPAPAGLKTTTVTVTVKNPVSYPSIMRFIHSLEANLTKMQLTGVTFRQDLTSNNGMVSIDPITIEVFIR